MGTFLRDAREQIAGLDLDLLFYLDLTMSMLVTRLAMSRLARVQAVSFGHPMTSGIDHKVMDYFVSWAAAEIPTAQEHYTEALELLPSNTMHLYYPRRTHGNGTGMVSTQTGQRFRHLRRSYFEAVPAEGRWYLCMQKPFKRHPEFDTMLANILKRDGQAQLILHGSDTHHEHEIIVKRLKRAGANMTRVHFLSVQEHHELLALYRLADVILDSYPAGGCTTTREALEIGGLVVTLPAKYLGSRWSYAYYSILGVMDMVAQNTTNYVDIAVQLASDKAYRAATRKRVRANLHKLFGRWEAVEAWTNLLSRIARDGQCDADQSGNSNTAKVCAQSHCAKRD